MRSKSKESKLSSETLELMRQRREFPSAGDTSSELRVLNKRIKKLIRRDLRRSNTRAIEAAIEQNRGSKVFVQQLGRGHLTKLRSADGNIVASKPEVLAEIEGFYGQLYASHAQKSVAQLTDSRAPLIRHYTDDIPDVDIGEIRIALEQLKNNKAPGEDGITTELLKAGGIAILEQLQRLFNSVLHNGITPEAWSESVVVLFFKKGDKTLLKNYRPISLLSHVYKLFSRVITNRLAQKLDEFQFRKGFSTIDHIHTVRQIIQKTEEYNQPLWTMKKPSTPSRPGQFWNPCRDAKSIGAISRC
ncbi:hypothetical protein JYU34_006348 [Plutella xylostella]|nr:hypothetical protein JYU34_006348 [Plutella xylostella]